jgi:hypothetical protein
LFNADAQTADRETYGQTNRGRAGRKKLVDRLRNFANAPKTALHTNTAGLFVSSETSLALLRIAGPAMFSRHFLVSDYEINFKAFCKNEELLYSLTLGDKHQCVDYT